MARLSSGAGINNIVLYALAGRGWTLLSSFVTLGLMVRYLSAEEQGFYYTFSAILGAQVLFELGMGGVMTLFASHAMAKLAWGEAGRLEGDAVASDSIRSLVRLALRWYGVLALIIILVIGPAGWLFLTHSAPNTAVHWQAAWVWLIVSAAINFTIPPVIGILEGCQCIAQMTKLRLVQSVVGSFVSWGTILAGGGLLALPAWTTAMALVALAGLIVMRGSFFRQMLERRAGASAHHISWFREIWPIQWRIALSWASGYFIFQLFVPAIFYARGPIEAGRVGLSMAIANALIGLPLAWLNTKTPQFGQLIATRDYHRLDTIWRRTTYANLAMLGAGGLLAIVILFALRRGGVSLAGRLMDIVPFTMLVLATIANFITIAQASYLRAHKEEPFLYVSIGTGLAVTLATFVLAKPYGTLGVMSGYLASSVVIGLTWGSRIFVLKRNIYRKRAQAS